MSFLWSKMISQLSGLHLSAEVESLYPPLSEGTPPGALGATVYMDGRDEIKRPVMDGVRRPGKRGQSEDRSAPQCLQDTQCSSSNSDFNAIIFG